MTEPDQPKRKRTFAAQADVAAGIAHAQGDLDQGTAELLRGTIDVLIGAGRHNITLDLADVTSIDTSGVNLLVYLRHSLRTHSGELSIVNARPAVGDALDRRRVAFRPLPCEQGC